MMRARDARLFAVALLAAPSLAAAQRTSSVRVGGVVVDAAHRGVDRVEVFLSKGDDELGSHTDSTGRFSFGILPRGEYTLSVRRIGYQPRTVSVQAGEGIEVVIEAMPLGLDSIHVVAQSGSQGKLREFYDRRSRQNRTGYFFEEKEIAAQDRWYVSELLRGLPGVTLEPATAGNLVRFRGCRPMLYLDGQRAEGMEVDDLVSARDVAALEVYVSPSGSPGQYRDHVHPCGSLLIWKKS